MARRRWILCLSMCVWVVSGCGAMGVETVDGWVPEMRYDSEPVRVEFWKDSEGRLHLQTMDGDPIRRQWKPVATFMALGPTLVSWQGAARELGCDAYHIGTELLSYGDMDILFSTEGEVAGIRIDHGEQICIVYTDEQAERDREAENTWVYTAYHRPPLNAGWNFAQTIRLNGHAGELDGGMVGYTMGLERYLRNFPLGFAARFGMDRTRDDALWILTGGTIIVPVYTLGSLQLAASASPVFGFSSKGSRDDTKTDGTAVLMAWGGAVDWVIGRWIALGMSAEMWTSLDDARGAPDDLAINFRYGFAF